MRLSKSRKSILSISTETPKAVKELLSLRGDSTAIKESLDGFADTDKIFRVMKKKKSPFFVACSKNKSGEEFLTIGRSFNYQPLEIIRFKVNKSQASSDFTTLPPELYVKYYCVLQDIKNKKIENLLVDMFYQPTQKVNLQAVRYAWVFAQRENVITAKFVRVLNDYSVEDIGPYFELEVEKEFYCTDELYTKALPEKTAKAQKNVTKNAFKDEIGKVYLEKQDLKDISLKKSRAYRK